ncbi:MAG TPA: hypothetical protein V6C52_02785 [Coleofasciculaceae cyanobacterium]|jgi:hypothetical protein
MNISPIHNQTPVQFSGVKDRIKKVASEVAHNDKPALAISTALPLIPGDTIPNTLGSFLECGLVGFAVVFALRATGFARYLENLGNRHGATAVDFLKNLGRRR